MLVGRVLKNNGSGAGRLQDQTSRAWDKVSPAPEERRDSVLLMKLTQAGSLFPGRQNRGDAADCRMQVPQAGVRRETEKRLFGAVVESSD